METKKLQQHHAFVSYRALAGSAPPTFKKLEEDGERSNERRCSEGAQPCARAALRRLSWSKREALRWTPLMQRAGLCKHNPDETSSGWDLRAAAHGLDKARARHRDGRIEILEGLTEAEDETSRGFTIGGPYVVREKGSGIKSWPPSARAYGGKIVIWPARGWVVWIGNTRLRTSRDTAAPDRHTVRR